METINKISDYEKIKQMSREDLEELANLIATVGHCFDKMEGNISCSLLDWFRVYATSEEFQKKIY